MALLIGDNFNYQANKPNFERDSFETLAAMKAFPETSIDDGHVSYCAETDKHYKYLSTNTTDANTGKWRVFTIVADAALSSTSTNAIQNKAVYDALQSKADTSALNSYVTTATANDTYATKKDLNNRLDKKVNIRGIGKTYNPPGTQEQIIKVVTITCPKTIYETGFLGLALMCRNEQLIRVLITINSNSGYDNYSVKAIESSTKLHPEEPLYYWYDRTNGKVMLYYKMRPYDFITAKVTDQDVNMNFTWSLDLEYVDALPKGAIQVHDVNYGNKNLFYATPKDAAGDPKFRAIDVSDLPTMTAATASAAGKAGIVPAPGAGKQSYFLRGDGVWAVPTFTVPIASATTLGSIKVGTNLSVTTDGILSVLTDTNVTDGGIKPITSGAVATLKKSIEGTLRQKVDTTTLDNYVPKTSNDGLNITAPSVVLSTNPNDNIVELVRLETTNASVAVYGDGNIYLETLVSGKTAYLNDAPIATKNDIITENATQSKAGLMSAEDKTKLDNINTAYVSIVTQAEYDVINPKEDNRIYYIKG